VKPLKTGQNEVEGIGLKGKLYKKKEICDHRLCV